MKGVNVLFSHKDAKTQSFFLVPLRLRAKEYFKKLRIL